MMDLKIISTYFLKGEITSESEIITKAVAALLRTYHYLEDNDNDIALDEHVEIINACGMHSHVVDTISREEVSIHKTSYLSKLLTIDNMKFSIKSLDRLKEHNVNQSNLFVNHL